MLRLSITHSGNVNVADASGKVWSLQYKPRTRIKNIEDEMLISPDFGIDGNIFSVMIPISGYRLKLVIKKRIMPLLTMWLTPKYVSILMSKLEVNVAGLFAFLRRN